MKRFEYRIMIKKTIDVYADDDDEAIDRALLEPIDATDCQITDIVRTDRITHKTHHTTYD